MHLTALPIALALSVLPYGVQAQDTADDSASDYELVRADAIDLALGNDTISLDPFDNLLEKRQRGMSKCSPSLQTSRGQLLHHGSLLLPGQNSLLPYQRDVLQLAEVLPEIMLSAERHLSTSTESECTVKPTANVRRTWLEGLADVFQGSEHHLEKRQRPFPKTCTTECHASGQRLPVVEFTPVRGETDELVKSMCAGMDGWYKRQKSGANGRHNIWTDLAKGEDVLTYGGPAKKNPDATDRRKDVQCKKFYKSDCEALGKKRGVAMECDEYPPAMSLEGGGLATRMCVPAKQNSRTQGPQFRLFVTTCGLKRGDKFLLRLKGGCSRFNFPARRDDATQTVGIADEDVTFRDPNDDGSLTYVAVGLGDLKVGHYEIDAKFNGSVREAVVLNQYGDEYASLDSPSQSAKMSFDVTDDYYQPAALIAYTEHPVKVSYNGTVQPGNTTGTPSPPKAPSSATVLGVSIVYTMATTLTLGLLQQLL
ncbi:hypothetical protein BDW42DRAFT_201424 [Aspergillus taichungensis]|uniref:Deoxyribonuclease NucA/NucB domain-containing protein n=1 Tax=Aspergillus taichungensis TaxID=482145 RepID=A0A2J5HRQ0_9EURO|nr:hypothetical protein BDW42DRAFT_201424 [Aspergillus taichungensis]